VSGNLAYNRVVFGFCVLTRLANRFGFRLT
jgi:hypothetical protein